MSTSKAPSSNIESLRKIKCFLYLYSPPHLKSRNSDTFMSQSWRPHASGRISQIPFKRHLELIGECKPVKNSQPIPPPIALVVNAWTGAKTYTICGKAFASRDDALRFRSRMTALHATCGMMEVEVTQSTPCGPECVPCAYGIYGACDRTRQSSVQTLQVARHLSETATTGYTEVLPTATIRAPIPSYSTSKSVEPGVSASLDDSAAFQQAMDVILMGRSDSDRT